MLQKSFPWLASPEWLDEKLPALYAVCALLLLLTYCLLTPPFYGPDELPHSERAVEIGHGEWVANLSPPGEVIQEISDAEPGPGVPFFTRRTTERDRVYGAPMDTALVALGTHLTYTQRDFVNAYPGTFHRPDGRIPGAILDPLRRTTWSGATIFANFGNTAVYSPLLYLPAALAWRIGQAENLTIFHALLLARVCNALCAAFFGWLALRLCDRGRACLFVCLLLPTVTSLEACCTQDALLTPVAAVAAALVMRCISRGRPAAYWELCLLTLALVACVGARPPYLALAAAPLLPLLELRGPRPRQWVPAVIAASVVVLAAAGWHLLVRAGGLSHSMVAEPAMQIAGMEVHPLRSTLVLAKSTALNVPGLLARGVLVLELKTAATTAAFFVLYLAAASWVILTARPAGLERWRSRAVLLLALLAVVAAISVAEYLIWTPVGSNTISGLQARYYLPLVPFAFLLGPRLRRSGRSEAAISRLTLFQPVAVILYLAVVVCYPAILAHRYYGTGLPTAMWNALR